MCAKRWIELPCYCNPISREFVRAYLGARSWSSMAASSGFAMTFALDTLVHGAASASSSPARSVATASSPSLVGLLGGATAGKNSRRCVIQRRSCVPLVSPRCEVGSDDSASLKSVRSSSISALEQLKTSGADRLEVYIDEEANYCCSLDDCEFKMHCNLMKYAVRICNHVI